MTLIYSPEGQSVRQSHSLAPTPAPLAELRIAALDNGKPGADWLLRAFGEELAQRTGASFVGVQRKGSAATPCEDALLERLAAEADLVVTGTAD
jgi:hypothetical protein